MALQLDAEIVPLALRLDGRVGLTLWAPPWTDAEDCVCEEFLGVEGSNRIALFPSATEMVAFIRDTHTNCFGDHPAWPGVQRSGAEALLSQHDDLVDLDEVYEFVQSAPDAATIDRLSYVVRLVTAVAEACEDRELADYLASSVYTTLRHPDISVHPRRLSEWWNVVAHEVLRSWEWVTQRVGYHLEWRGDFSVVDSHAVFAQAQPRLAGTRSHGSVQSYTAPGYSTLAIVAFVLVFVTAFGIPSIVCGELALREIRRTGKDGRGLARAALVLGYLEFIGLVVLIIGAAASLRS